MAKTSLNSLKKIAKDIMTPNPKFIQSGEDLVNTVKIFIENGIHYSPVVTPVGEVLGLMSEVGLVKAALKNYLEQDQPEKVATHRDIMESVTAVEENDTIEHVMRQMLKSNCHRVLVFNPQNKLVGIISPRDILRLIMGDETESENVREELARARAEAERLGTEVKNLQMSLDRYQTVVKDSPHMIHGVDEKGNIIMANKKMHLVLGYEDGELIGKHLKDLYAKAILPDAYEGLDRVKKEGHHHTTYTTMLTKNGRKIRVDISSSSLRDKQGKFISTITISREINSEALLRALHNVVEDVDATTGNSGKS